MVFATVATEQMSRAELVPILAKKRAWLFSQSRSAGSRTWKRVCSLWRMARKGQRRQSPSGGSSWQNLTRRCRGWKRRSEPPARLLIRFRGRLTKRKRSVTRDRGVRKPQHHLLVVVFDSLAMMILVAGARRSFPVDMMSCSCRLEVPVMTTYLLYRSSVAVAQRFYMVGTSLAGPFVSGKVISEPVTFSGWELLTTMHPL
mmetsp:Transcript_92333/g.246985  ORF Transcript_92333/g.246985 Transcript_92333/m.246985 type:complete len:201 (+) Transcript_92333:312-914(+)